MEYCWGLPSTLLKPNFGVGLGLEPVIQKFEAEGWTVISRLIIDRCYYNDIQSPSHSGRSLKGDFES